MSDAQEPSRLQPTRKSRIHLVRYDNICLLFAAFASIAMVVSATKNDLNNWMFFAGITLFLLCLSFLLDPHRSSGKL